MKCRSGKHDVDSPVGRCKECLRATYARYNQTEKAKEARRARQRAYRLADPEKYRAKHAVWREKNNNYQKEWRKRNPEAASLISRRGHLKRKYGLSLDNFEEMLAEQGGGCAICGSPESIRVDHDHKTGLIRGLLCHKCNVRLAALDDESWFVSASRYLKW